MSSHSIDSGGGRPGERLVPHLLTCAACQGVGGDCADCHGRGCLWQIGLTEQMQAGLRPAQTPEQLADLLQVLAGELLAESRIHRAGGLHARADVQSTAAVTLHVAAYALLELLRQPPAPPTPPAASQPVVRMPVFGPHVLPFALCRWLRDRRTA